MARGAGTKACADCGRPFLHSRYVTFCSSLCERRAGAKTIARREAARAVVGVALGLELREVFFVARNPRGTFSSPRRCRRTRRRGPGDPAIAGGWRWRPGAGVTRSAGRRRRGVDNQLGAQLLSEHRAVVEEAVGLILGAPGGENLADELTELIRVRSGRAT